MDAKTFQEIKDIVADIDWWRRGMTDEAAQRRQMLARQKAVLARGDRDPALSVVASFEETVLINALFCDDVARAQALVDLRFPPEAVARGTPSDSDHKVQSMAVCVLAVAGQDDRALALMAGLGREADSQFWRFGIFRDDGPGLFARCGRDRWLDRLARTADYQAIFERYRSQWVEARDLFANGPLRMVEDATLGGKAKKKCVLSGDKLDPGADIVRFRRAFEGEVNDMHMAGRAAFDASPLAQARAEFEQNRVPFAAMFPPLAQVRDYIHDPAIARFYQDMADGIAFDPRRAAHLIGQPGRKPIAYVLEGEGRSYDRSVPAYHNSDGHGEAGRLLWRLIRTGQFAAVADAAQTLPDADTFFALAACYDDNAVAARAARHFDLPDLPAMVGLALRGRANAKTATRLADYGAAHPRWRKAIANAMERYALNLYSGMVPSVNWFYAGWDRFSRAYGTSLMYFCVDTPEDIPALAASMRARKLLRGDGGANTDCYSVCGPMFYQAALLSLHRNDPAELAGWLAADWMTQRCKSPAEKAMRKFVGA